MKTENPGLFPVAAASVFGASFSSLTAATEKQRNQPYDASFRRKCVPEGETPERYRRPLDSV